MLDIFMDLPTRVKDGIIVFTFFTVLIGGFASVDMFKKNPTRVKE